MSPVLEPPLTKQSFANHYRAAMSQWEKDKEQQFSRFDPKIAVSMEMTHSQENLPRRFGLT
jgi:hypothetical protein